MSAPAPQPVCLQIATILSLAHRSDTNTSKYATSAFSHLVTSLEDIVVDRLAAQQRSGFRVSAVAAQALRSTKSEMLESIYLPNCAIGSGRPA
jgi:hypothetical protein